MDSDTDTLPKHISSTLWRRGVACKAAPSVAVPNPLILQPLPRWVGSSKALETRTGQGVSPSDRDAAFAAGAAAFALDQIIRAEPPWLGCLRMRLTIRAAAVASRLLRLNADEASLRDAEHLTRPGDDPGPAGRLHRLLRQLASRPTRLADETLSAIATEIEGSVTCAELLALLRADLALAVHLGWERPLLLHIGTILDPDLRQGSAGKRPRADQPEWPDLQYPVLACAAANAHAQAVTLARKAEVLAAMADTLRTRDGGRGVGLILSDDSVAPWRMARKGDMGGQGKEGLGSDRAARRLCESLQAMGALRLLTDRPTFRLYGL